MRGVPGSGKSTLADALPWATKIEADSFFKGSDGKYHFQPKLLNTAHAWCQKKCRKAMEEGDPNIIVSNTNVEKWMFEPYLELAKEFGYVVQYLIVHTPGQQNIHECPEEKVQEMERRLLDSLCTEGF
jgi:predicted kinase